MHTTTQQPVCICLFELSDKDQAVIQRVVTFAASQGKNYVLQADPQTAHIVVVDGLVDFPAKHHTFLIRIGEQENPPCDLLLKRPLLVTRVMRALEDAAKMLKTTPPAAEQAVETVVASITEIPIETPAAEPDSRYLALIVDDSAAIRKQLEIELRDAQIRTEFAETGEEALEKAAQQHYDLVFLDIIMPGIDGYEVCKSLRKRPEMKKTPIIMLSGKTSPLDEVQGVLAGASTYLTKPVKHEQFQQTLKRVSKWLTEYAR